MEQPISHSGSGAADPDASSGVRAIKTSKGPSKGAIIDGHAMTFDPGDKLNGSLYICEKLGGDSTLDKTQLLMDMRTAGIWTLTGRRPGQGQG